MHSSRSLTQVLCARAQRGDGQAYRDLFAQAEERLRLFVRLRLGAALRERVEVEDVIQETYLVAHRDFERFECRDGDAFARWLCCLAEHAIRDLADHHRAAKRSPGRPLRGESGLVERSANATGPVTAAARLEVRQRLELALGELADEEREVVLLRFFGGLTVDEIARRIELSPTTVRRRLGQAQRALGRRLRGVAP